MKIKCSDFVARFLKKQGIKHVWAVTGGASIHLMHSCAKEGIGVICPHHEQAGAMAADAYSRVTRNLGCAIATSGPGATNMLTGIAGAYFDSVPVLFLTGQVAKDRMRGDTGIRQLGFQETDILSMSRPVTKYCQQISKATDIRCKLEEAVYIAKSGRPGPVLIDIPDDIQREMIDPDDLGRYTYGNTYTQNCTSPVPKDTDIKKCVQSLKKAKRPVLILGWGIRLGKAELHLMSLIKKLGIPVCPTWGMMDYLPTNHKLKVGGFGINGSRASNFTVQNADFILAIGARLSTRETGNSLKDFAREAETFIVDIDPCELNKFSKFGKEIIPIKTDAKYFIKYLLNELEDYKPNIKEW
jgi:acetolactate synthase-1/2/3 large subunit